MRKRLLAVGLLAFLVGCGQQPELDVSAEQNKTKPVTEKNVTKAQKENVIQKTELQAQPEETDLTDNTNVIEVSQNSVNLDDSNNRVINQSLAQILSQKIIHFDFDKYEIKNSQLPIIQEVANLLKEATENYTVRIEGNCDEWGTDEYNYALGLKRAKVIKQSLIELGVDANKLTIISYGESNPVCTAHTKECWANNRRDNFTLLP